MSGLCQKLWCLVQERCIEPCLRLLLLDILVLYAVDHIIRCPSVALGGCFLWAPLSRLPSVEPVVCQNRNGASMSCLDRTLALAVGHLFGAHTTGQY
jgi:hypothetical protein